MNNTTNEEEIQRLEEQISGMECDLEMHYCQMGKELLEMADSELKTVNALVDDIIDARRKLAHAKRETQCTDCMAYNTADSNYCKRCGRQLQHTQAAGLGD